MWLGNDGKNGKSGKSDKATEGDAKVTPLARVTAMRRPGKTNGGSGMATDDEALAGLVAKAREHIRQEREDGRGQGEIARSLGGLVAEHLREAGHGLNPMEVRDIVTSLLAMPDDSAAGNAAPSRGASVHRVEPPRASRRGREPEAPRVAQRLDLEAGDVPIYHVKISRNVEQTRRAIQADVMAVIDPAKAAALPRDQMAKQLGAIVDDQLKAKRISLNGNERGQLIEILLDHMLALGPIEPLMQDETVTDILVNGAGQVYIERLGKLELTDISFEDDAQVMNIAVRIVNSVGRRIDERTPLADARLQDGSRVNVIVPPLALDGPSISIRKFAKRGITLDQMVENGNMSEEIATVLKVAARSRLNVLISGGTGSGKTTLLNAMSQLIDHGERIVTIEDAAELRLQQPHIVRLETRIANLEGDGAVIMRDLVKNALRMRPDRIIVGEIRGDEVIDMLQAMNTGHEGSMSTVHANRPREALTRLENMIGMAGFTLPGKAMRTQIAEAIDLIVQISRMRDGTRRVTHVMEVVGMEGEVITTQDLFLYQFKGEGEGGRLQGEFVTTGIRPHFLPRAAYYGLDRALLEVL